MQSGNTVERRAVTVQISRPDAVATTSVRRVTSTAMVSSATVTVGRAAAKAVIVRGASDGNASQFLGLPTHLDDAANDFFYIGWDGSTADPVRVRRIARNPILYVCQDATVSAGSDFEDLWAARASLDFDLGS